MRTLDEITKEYTFVCAQLGNAQYLKKAQQDVVAKSDYEIEKLMNKLQSLNKEAEKVKSGEDAQALAQSVLDQGVADGQENPDQRIAK